MTDISSSSIERAVQYSHCCYFFVLLFAIVGCSDNSVRLPINNTEANVNLSSGDKKVTPPNELGFSKISFYESGFYHEGILDAQGREVIRPSSALLINDLTGNLAVVQMERKFLFVPLDQGFVSAEDLESVNGFQYAEPFQCGFALTKVNDDWFYIDSNFEKAFDSNFEFAESFHHDRALVYLDGHFRVIDILGKTVANLNFDQVNPQSPWCWQVANIEGEKYLSGFVDLNGNSISELVYDYVGKYDPEVKRIPVVSQGLHGFLDELANVVIPLKYEHAEIFDRGKARVVLNGRSFYVNPDGLEILE